MHQAANKSRGGDGKYAWQINRKGQPEEVAALIAWLLCDQSTYITGTVQVWLDSCNENPQADDNS